MKRWCCKMRHRHPSPAKSRKLFIQISEIVATSCLLLLPPVSIYKCVHMYFNANKVEKLYFCHHPPGRFWPLGHNIWSKPTAHRTHASTLTSKSASKIVVRKFTSFAFSHTHLTDAISTTTNRYYNNNKTSPAHACRFGDTEIQKYLARFQHFAYVTPPKLDK